MKTILMKFANQVLTREEIRNVKGGDGYSGGSCSTTCAQGGTASVECSGDCSTDEQGAHCTQIPYEIKHDFCPGYPEGPPH